MKLPKNFFGWVDQPAWMKRFLVAAAVCLVMYAANAVFAEIDPGNWWGIFYGSAAGALMGGAALLGIRRRMMRAAAKRSLGKAQAWVQFHLYGGALSLLLVLMHSRFSFPDGLLNRTLWILSVWVTASGLAGVAIQKIIPRILSSGLTIEVLYDRIPELVAQVRESAEKLIAGCSEPVRDFYLRNLAPALVTPEQRFMYYIDITGGIQSRLRQFAYLRRVLPAVEQEKLDTLETMYRTKLEIDAHYTLQKALRLWLYTHVPLSLVLVLLILIHLYAVLYY